jgi:arabinofuranosyltransferase
MTRPALFPAVVWLLLGVAVARCAWMSDDAYVTLRTLDNFVHGLGLRFNPAERVQAYTHPLWLAVLAVPYAVTRDGWVGPMVVGAATTLTAAGLLALRVARDPWGAGVALAVLVGSKAAVDYATSGLENPLENLLLVGFVAELVGRGRLVVLTLLVALLGTTRLDALLLVGPAWAVVAWSSPGREQLRSLVGWLPLVVWHAGALVYYGAVLPNTAGAKLGTGIPTLELAAHGLWYYAWTARFDPVALPAIAAGLAAAVVARDRRSLALALGVGLHLVWILRIGGDFMGGRFFVAPLWVAAMLLARASWSPRWAAAATAATLLALLSPYAPLRSGPGYVKAPPSHGVVDERGYYWAGTGLWGGSSVARGPRHEFARDGRAARGTPVVVKSVIGLFGYTAGPATHVVDRLALADPLLSRLPAQYHPGWRIGHFRRRVPDGYVASLPHGENRIGDPDVRALYDAVRLATREPLLAPGRWTAIVGLQLGWYPVDLADARYPDVRWVDFGGPPVAVGEGGVAVRTIGRTGTAKIAGSAGTWHAITERGSARVEHVTGSGELTVGLDGTDRLVIFGPEGGDAELRLTP